MDVENRTCLSAGMAIRELLLQSRAVKSRVKKIFPVIVDNAELPYVVYRRVAVDSTALKGGRPADVTQAEVECYAKSYGESVDLAECVRDALDGHDYPDMGIGICRMVNSEEDFLADAFVQRLVFEIM